MLYFGRFAMNSWLLSPDWKRRQQIQKAPSFGLQKDLALAGVIILTVYGDSKSSQKRLTYHSGSTPVFLVFTLGSCANDAACVKELKLLNQDMSITKMRSSIWKS